MLKYSALACVTALTVLTIGSLPLVAQTPSEQTPSEQTPTTTEGTPPTERRLDRSALIDLNRAKNLARQAAERANGGLGYYRAESSMHGSPAQSPYVDNGNGTWTFTFKGTRPGETIPSYESVVTVSKEGNVTTDYNGPVRASTP